MTYNILSMVDTQFVSFKQWKSFRGVLQTTNLSNFEGNNERKIMREEVDEALLLIC